MKKFSIMESQHNLAHVLREVEAGYEVGITRRKKLVAVVSRPEDDPPVQFPDFAERAARIWESDWTGASSGDLLDDTRGER